LGDTRKARFVYYSWNYSLFPAADAVDIEAGFFDLIISTVIDENRWFGAVSERYNEAKLPRHWLIA
jgi:hypothetical protein